MDGEILGKSGQALQRDYLIEHNRATHLDAEALQERGPTRSRPHMAHRDVSLRRTDCVAIGAIRTCRERRERVDPSRLTQYGPRPPLTGCKMRAMPAD